MKREISDREIEKKSTRDKEVRWGEIETNKQIDRKREKDATEGCYPTSDSIGPCVSVSERVCVCLCVYICVCIFNQPKEDMAA